MCGTYLSLAGLSPAFHHFLVQLFHWTTTEAWLMKVHFLSWELHCLCQIAICSLHFRLLTQMVERSQSQLKSLRWGSPWVIRTLIDKSYLFTVGLAQKRCAGGELAEKDGTGMLRAGLLSEYSSLEVCFLPTDHCRSTATRTREPVRCDTTSLWRPVANYYSSLSFLSLSPPSPSQSWNTLVHKNFEIERACLDLERELYQLRQEAKER